MTLGRPSDPGDSTEDVLEKQIERLERLVHERPNYADLHYRLGLLLRNRGRQDEAIAAFRQAVLINPVYQKALIKLGLALHEDGRHDEATAILTRAQRLDPESADLHYKLGLLFADQERFELAVEEFEAAVATEPANVDFHTNLALALQNMGLLDRASAGWETLSEILSISEAGRSLLDDVQRGAAD